MFEFEMRGQRLTVVYILFLVSSSRGLELPLSQLDYRRVGMKGRLCGMNVRITITKIQEYSYPITL